MASSEQGGAFTVARFDGILGLGFPPISVGKLPPVLETMAKQDSISSALVAFYLPSDPSYYGEIAFGSPNPACAAGPTAWTPVTDAGYWQIDMKSVSLGHTALETDFKAIVDTGTSLVAAPKAFVEELLAGLDYRDISGQYFAPCDAKHKLPEVVFRLNGTRGGALKLTGKDYMLDLALPGPPPRRCMVGFFAMDLELEGKSSPRWILGDVFLRKFYTIFDADNRRVGFAPAAAPSDDCGG